MLTNFSNKHPVKGKFPVSLSLPTLSIGNEIRRKGTHESRERVKNEYSNTGGMNNRQFIFILENQLNKKSEVYTLTSKINKSKMLDQRNVPASPNQTASMGKLHSKHFKNY